MRTIIGKCLGVKSREVGKEGNKFTVHEVGIGEKVNDGFGTEETVKLRIGDKQYKEGLHHSLNKLVGKDCQLAYFETVKENKGRVYKTLYALHLLDPAQPASKQNAA